MKRSLLLTVAFTVANFAALSDTIPTLPATSATAFEAGTVSGSVLLAYGPPFTIQANSGVPGQPPVFVQPGSTLLPADLRIGLPSPGEPGYFLRGGIQINGGDYGIELASPSGDGVLPLTSVVVPTVANVAVTVTVPARLTGGYTLLCDYTPPGEPKCADGLPLANVSFDLPGEESITFGPGPSAQGPVQLAYKQFLSTPVPEPATPVLVFLAAALITSAVAAQRAGLLRT